MKWQNKGHEFDKKYDEFKNYLKNADYDLCVFGAGKIGQESVSFLINKGFRVVALIDNSTSLIGTDINEIPIISFDTYKKKYRTAYVIISMSDRYSDEVSEQLKNSGLKENINFCDYYTFKNFVLPLIDVYENNRLLINVIEMALTERCTLKCKKCAHGCWNVPMNKPDYPYSEAVKSAEMLFSLVDHVDEFYLIGGEPLLYKELSKTISYIGIRFRSKISKLIITTNGTIIPKDEVLKASQDYNVNFYISNYSMTIPNLIDQYKKLCDVLDRWGIPYQLSGKERKWYDYGFGHVDHGFKYEIVEKIHDHCFTQCREIRGTRLYYCIQARSVAENMAFDVSKDDYLELSELPEKDAKKTIFEYIYGYCDKGYIDMCNYCNGADSLNHPIPVAEQVRTNE